MTEQKRNYNPVGNYESSIQDRIDKYKIIPRVTVVISTIVYVYCIYTNKPFEVIEFAGYIYAVFVLIYIVGIDSLKDILDWWYKIQKLKKGYFDYSDEQPSYRDYERNRKQERDNKDYNNYE